MISPAPATVPPNTSPMHWCPRQTPSTGVPRSPKYRATSLEIPAFAGFDGPGEMTTFSGLHLCDVLNRRHVVTIHDDVLSKLGKVLVQVVRKAVVVIEQEDHRAPPVAADAVLLRRPFVKSSPASRAANMPRAFARDSSYSVLGTLS